MIRYIKYNTNDQLWIDDNKPLYCIDDGGRHYDFRSSSLIQLLPCPYCGIENHDHHDLTKHIPYQSQ